MHNYNEVQNFKNEHRNCSLKVVLTADKKNTVVILCATHNSHIITSIPYRQFCLHIDKCAGLNSCPRNYSCCE